MSVEKSRKWFFVVVMALVWMPLQKYELLWRVQLAFFTYHS
jgi:hypothetical protein